MAGSVLEVAVPRAPLLSGDNAGMASFALVWNGTIAGALRLMSDRSLALSMLGKRLCWQSAPCHPYSCQ